jgi:hypothetical protein
VPHKRKSTKKLRAGSVIYGHTLINGAYWDRKTGKIKQSLGFWVLRPGGDKDYFMPVGPRGKLGEIPR